MSARARPGGTDRGRERWAAEITSRAASVWTPERTRSLLGDKALRLPPVEAAPLLRAIGLLNGDGSMPPRSVRKYMQVNHMLALLETHLAELGRGAPVVRLLDAGCGASHLGLLVAWWLDRRLGRRAEVLGVDRDPVVLEGARGRAALALLDGVTRFEVAALGELDLPGCWARAFGPMEGEPRLHGLLALHACDTATDEALALAVGERVELAAVAPCCHAELSARWAGLAESGADGALAPVWRAPHLRREAASSLTDAMRVLLLRACGYDVTPMEFVPSAHTPKNTLLRALRRGRTADEPLDQYVALGRALGGVGIRLAELLPAERRAALAEAERRAGGEGREAPRRGVGPSPGC